MANFDLYEDLLVSEVLPSEQELSLIEKVNTLKGRLEEAEKQSAILARVNLELKEKCDALEKNLSSLIKTSRNEINRKNDTIHSLKREIDSLILRRSLSLGKKQEYEQLKTNLSEIFLKYYSPLENKLLVENIKGPEPPLVYLDAGKVQTVSMGNTSVSFIQHQGPWDASSKFVPKGGALVDGQNKRHISQPDGHAPDREGSHKSENTKRPQTQSSRPTRPRSTKREQLPSQSPDSPDRSRRPIHSTRSTGDCSLRGREHRKSLTSPRKRPRRDVTPPDLANMDTSDLDNAIDSMTKKYNSLANKKEKYTRLLEQQSKAGGGGGGQTEQPRCAKVSTATEARCSRSGTNRRTTSEVRSVADLSSASGIASILKGDLLSYMGPKCETTASQRVSRIPK